MNVFELVEEHFKMQQGGTWEKQKAKVQKENYQGNNLLEMLQEDKDLVERLSKKDRIKKETNIKTSDNTKVNTKNKPELISKSARNKTDKEIAEERKARIEDSEKAQDIPYTANNWREVLARETQATGDKFRVSNEPNFFDDYLNPAVMIGDMASNLGQAPLRAQQSDSVLPYVTAIGTPLAVGAMAGIGTQNTGQFVNNLANPLAGTRDLVNNLGNKYLPNAYKLNPNAFKPNPDAYYRTLGKEGIDDAFNSGVIRPKQTSNVYSPEAGKRIDVNTPEFPEGSYFNKSEIYSTKKMYNPDYIAEVVGKDNLFTYPERIVFNENIRVAPNNIPIEQANFYKKDWLKGYKQVEVPKTEITPIRDLFIQPKQKFSDPILSNIEEPYISKKVFNDSKEQQVFESSFQPEQQAKLLEDRTKYYDNQGNVIPKPSRFLQQGGKFTENENKFLEELAQLKLI
jgi:hypothetical protein